ncbi:uncharacterized protein EV422DRAFT_571119 [Fimicolochytrium jonesii]|uniref:uncharacterized protein n=1 Tax=Fimicolochytrium jonesii TaxID=1396493 RepID=UPI0022FF0BD2|nr:uncharacterized protein EV422DRAFT_571119 [Fimicolochytrium jonesii]KAI8817030.1 hypothetical protein EV422DRAFT_571119 [Fimicolochytrium jonesii]
MPHPPLDLHPPKRLFRGLRNPAFLTLTVITVTCSVFGWITWLRGGEAPPLTDQGRVEQEANRQGAAIARVVTRGILGGNAKSAGSGGKGESGGEGKMEGKVFEDQTVPLEVASGKLVDGRVGVAPREIPDEADRKSPHELSAN